MAGQRLELIMRRFLLKFLAGTLSDQVQTCKTSPQWTLPGSRPNSPTIGPPPYSGGLCAQRVVSGFSVELAQSVDSPLDAYYCWCAISGVWIRPPLIFTETPAS